MPLKLTSLTYGSGPAIEASYELTHSTPSREGTTLAEPLTLYIRRDQTVVSLQINDCQAATPDEALTKLQSWLRRLADGLEQRGPSVQMPV